MLAESPYEKIVGYADWRTFATRDVGTVYIPTTVSKDEAMERTRRYNPPSDQLSAVQDLCEYIEYITDSQVDA